MGPKVLARVVEYIGAGVDERTQPALRGDFRGAVNRFLD